MSHRSQPCFRDNTISPAQRRPSSDNAIFPSLDLDTSHKQASHDTASIPPKRHYSPGLLPSSTKRRAYCPYSAPSTILQIKSSKCLRETVRDNQLVSGFETLCLRKSVNHCSHMPSCNTCLSSLVAARGHGRCEGDLRNSHARGYRFLRRDSARTRC